jgi:serine/threonine protein kinase
LPQPSTLIEGKYEILGKMREGGMGTIYRVRHRLLDEIRVIKVLKAQALSDEDMKRRFVEEARTATRLKHPNIGAIHDFALDEEGKAYLVMEYIDGVNLAEILRQQGPPGLTLSLEVAHQTLLALGYLHRKNIVHRDIAPDNLMLTQDEDDHPRVKLIDLGIAKTLDRPGEMTSTGVFLGKIKYASPEQFGALTAGEKLDGRSDIYALGVVLYELLTGIHPFVGESPTELLRAHIFDPPLPFSETDKARRVPPELRAAIQMALEKRREDRFSSAEEFDRQIVVLKQQYSRTGELGDTAELIARVRAVPPALSEPSATPSAQDRLDQHFVAASTPPPSHSSLKRSLDEELTEVVPFAPSGPTSLGPAAPAFRRHWMNSRIASVLGAIIVLAAGALVLPRLLKRSEPARVVVAPAAVPTKAPEKPSLLAPAAPEPTAVLPQPTAVAEASSPSPDSQLTTENSRLPPAPAPDPGLPRREAERARSRAASARQRAEREKAPEQAAALYDFGRGKEREARDLFAREEFAAARAASEAARDSFDKAEEWARRHSPARATPSEKIAAAAESAPRREPPAVAAPQVTAAPVPVRAATAAPVAAEPPRGSERSTDEEKIRDVIRRYEKAQSTLDSELYARVYPSVDKARVRAAFEQLRSQKLVVEIQKIEVAPGATTAVVRGLEKREAVPQVGSEQHAATPRVITLEKHGDGWVIVKLAS